MTTTNSRKRAAIEWRTFDDFDDLKGDVAAFHLARSFYAQTKGCEFSSDDFRALDLDEKMVRRDKAIGGFFSMITRLGLVVQTGWVRSRIPSNNRRKIRTYRWTDLARESLG